MDYITGKKINYIHTLPVPINKQKPIVYDPKAKPKLFGKFLSQVLYAEI